LDLTKERTKELWKIVRTPRSEKKFSDLSKKYGIKDSINLKFIQNIRAMPTKTREDRQAIIDKCEILDEDFGDLLFNPLLDLKGFLLFSFIFIFIQDFTQAKICVFNRF
jgi:hypothetical protein